MNLNEIEVNNPIILETMSTEKTAFNVNDLTDEQIIEIGKKAKALEKAKKQNEASQKATLKALKNDFTIEEVEAFLPVRDNVELLINQAFEKHKIIMDLEVEQNGTDILNQNSHSNTLSDGSFSFTIGFNMTDTFDGNEGVGVQKVKQYIDSLKGDDPAKINLAEALNIFLKPHPITGMLNPSSLKQLSKLRFQYDNELFTEGIEIIEKSAIKIRSSQFIEGWKMITLEDGQFKKVKFRFSV